jgi:4-hydroxy-tetrahydrodipicolinate reductase
MLTSPTEPSPPVRVVHYGLGPIGIGIARLVAERPSLRSVGAIDVNPQLAGRSLAEVANLGTAAPEPVVSADAAGVLAGAAGAVVVHCTGSSLAREAPRLLAAVEAGCHVVSTCEELSFPWTAQPALARRLDEAARASGVVVLGTGVNPGFAMDYLPLVLSGVARRIDAVIVHRVQDAGVRRLPLQRKVGAGMTVEEFRRKADAHELGHVGLRESAHALAAALGWPLDRLDETIEPVVAERPTPSGLGEIEPGGVTGLRQTAVGQLGGRMVVSLTLEMAVGLPDMRDDIRIAGDPDLHLIVPGGLHGDVATAAIVVNAIGRLVEARPGLRVMADLPPVHP